jgi:hypothetical protein
MRILITVNGGVECLQTSNRRFTLSLMRSRIRIRIKVKSWKRILVKVMRIWNQCYESALVSIRIRIQGAKPMRTSIHEDPDPDQTLPVSVRILKLIRL